MIAILIAICVVFTVGFVAGGWLLAGNAWSRGFDAGFAAATDPREVIPAEGTPFVRLAPIRIDAVPDTDWAEARYANGSVERVPMLNRRPSAERAIQ